MCVCVFFPRAGFLLGLGGLVGWLVGLPHPRHHQPHFALGLPIGSDWEAVGSWLRSS